jgi:hypothetical protein
VINVLGSIDINNAYARGNVYASDDTTVVTFAGGLIGMMAHFGEVNISNAYSTGAVGVENNATDTRLVAGGFIGAGLDLGIVPIGMITGFGAGGGNNEMIVNYVLEAIGALGVDIKHGINISNSFSVSSVPAQSEGPDNLFYEIGLGAPTDYVTSGNIFGFVFSLDIENFPEFPVAEEGQSLSGEALGEFFNGIQWNPLDSMVSNTYFDASQSDATQCAATVPEFTDFFFDLQAAMNEQPIPSIPEGEQPQTMEEIIDTVLPELVTAEGTCSGVNASGTESAYFIDTKSVAPLNTWDFDSTWYGHDADYPTFTADPEWVEGGTTNGGNGGGGDTNGEGSGATDTPNPNPGDDSPFIPTTITPDDIEEFSETVVDLLPTQEELTEVLPQIVENLDKEADEQAAAITAPPEDNSLISTVVGILSATGMFLLRNLITVALLMIIGAMLWFYNRKTKALDSAIKKTKLNP